MSIRSALSRPYLITRLQDKDLCHSLSTSAACCAFWVWHSSLCLPLRLNVLLAGESQADDPHHEQQEQQVEKRCHDHCRQAHGN